MNRKARFRVFKRTSVNHSGGQAVQFFLKLWLVTVGIGWRTKWSPELKYFIFHHGNGWAECVIWRAHLGVSVR
jgi:hypothetical protein